VTIPTTPAQYFHALRRQIHRKFRKPLIVFSPKSMLRYEPSFSGVEEFTAGSFRNVIDDPNASQRDKVRRLLLCTGKVFYTLDAARQKSPTSEVAVVRVEQLYPFPQGELLSIIEQYPRVEEVAWVQEEPQNRGAWNFMEPRLRAMFPDKLITYFGRDFAASPATGSSKAHQGEEKEILSAALAVHPRAIPAHAVPATSHSRAVSD
jgi:2-oxoglutarate dehydrogenase complex dehydrogenase (E1) component-like enzyme